MQFEYVFLIVQGASIMLQLLIFNVAIELRNFSSDVSALSAPS
jgi:hypothetical protein